ncbi:Calmodulin-binding protein trpl [Operophtera brumata]|uniref:Tektin n=1 Tax=Operophtera brumata TaxID=104452 RepID=A0A0L7KQQ7_OPEBR|nr:Calmodulin-binding protein trpl [Operophtera brumata]
MFTPDITPLMLAAHKNNYEIIKILLDRGAAVPNPHDVRYHAPDVGSTQEQLRDYQDIARSRSGRPKPSRCQSRSSQELAIILNHDPDEPGFVAGEHMKLARLELAIDFKQKKAIILNHDPDEPGFVAGEHMKLARLELAIDFKQKKAIILNHDPDEPGFMAGEHMKLARLELAIDFKQKKAIILNHDPDEPGFVAGEHMKLARLELAIYFKQKKAIILNHDPDEPGFVAGEHMKLARLELAIDFKQKKREITSILGGQSLLKRVLEQLNEQMRRLRATRYLLDRDLQYKQGAIDLDMGSLSLKPTDLCLSVYEGYANLDPAQISADEYNAYSGQNIKMAAREVTSARPIRMFVDTLLKQVINDLLEAYKKCNHAFHERIKETHLAKAKLEDMHRETTEKIAAMQYNILQLQKALADKEGNTALAHTRLGRRAQRIGAELVRDAPGQALYYECEMLRHSTEQLQQMLQEASASLRFLLQTQIQLEEDINVKMNTLKIDEVDCMVLRDTMDYHSY